MRHLNVICVIYPDTKIFSNTPNIESKQGSSLKIFKVSPGKITFILYFEYFEPI